MGAKGHGDYDVYLCQLDNAIRVAEDLLADKLSLDEHSCFNELPNDWIAWAERVLKNAILPALKGARNIANEKKL